jgi:uncharacterized damage-inducible protein DinB
MEHSSHYGALARYNRWMNERLYRLAGELTDEERKRDMHAFFRSVHGTFNHLVLTDRVWLARFTGDRELATVTASNGERIAIRSLDQELFSDFGELRRVRDETDSFIETWVETLTPARLAATLAYGDSKGNPHEHPLWWAVSHFFNHQTHHRGQLTTLLSQLGRDPGVTDLIAMLRTAPPAPEHERVTRPEPG